MAHHAHTRSTSPRNATFNAAPVAIRLVVIVACIAAIVSINVSINLGARGDAPPTLVAPGNTSPPPATPVIPTVASTDPTLAPVLSTTEGSAPVTPQATIAPSLAPRVGIVAGHWGSNDTGAVCPDGLQEVEINYEVAQRVVYILQALGYEADLLAEYDSRLKGYEADALVSIHADSCEPFPNATPPASGFKVASVQDSMVPELERELVLCLAQSYAARTGMYFHENSITYDMLYYHNFYEIHNDTPGAIIETGFMHADRAILTERSDLVAQGIVDGIVCFLESD